MIKNRHFMMGLGVGLIVGALLLQLMLIGQEGSGKLWTKEQVEQAAALLNLKVVEHEDELLTKEEWEAQSEPAAGSGENSKSESIDKKADTPEDPKAPTVPDTPATDNGTKDTAKTTSPETPKTDAPKEPSKPEATEVQYKISYGNTLTNVADGLHKKGIIANKNEFIKQAKARKINSKIRTGTYSFQVGEDYDSIIDKIIAPR
ncbi:hypothetical protein [Paenibacillus sp. GM2]|uniref:hypothetical protein n=1 Tax=Paenibacillus sp. GM2 TaxID=1622070 RepID=UPI00083834F7|nr:hypothetical protein [Paenibacillus sp. GM2]